MKDLFSAISKDEAQFQKVIKAFEAYVGALECIDSNKKTISSMRAVLVYLNGLDATAIGKIFAQSKTRIKPKSPGALIVPEDAVITAMSLSDVAEVIRSNEASLKYLQRIAAVRFAIPPGALSRLSREKLIEELFGKIENEKTHETISRLASGRD